MIYYFSGCGNSRFIAESIAQALNEPLVFIPEAEREGNLTLQLAQGERLGFVFPIYSWPLASSLSITVTVRFSLTHTDRLREVSTESTTKPSKTSTIVILIHSVKSCIPRRLEGFFLRFFIDPILNLAAKLHFFLGITKKNRIFAPDMSTIIYPSPIFGPVFHAAFQVPAKYSL